LFLETTLDTMGRDDYATFAESSPKNHALRFLILYQEIIRVKFKENRINFNKTMDRNKILCDIRNMKNIV
jgi:hypothetical protein